MTIHGVTLLVLLLLWPAPAPAWVACDGVDDSLYAPSGTVAPGTELTLAAWVYLLGPVTGWGALFVHDNAVTGWRHDAAGLMMFHGLNDTSFTGGTALPQNVWTHVAVVVAGTSILHYRNGVVESGGTINGVPTSNLRLACANAVPADPFLGRIAELTAYPAALSAPEIAALAATRTSYLALTRPTIAYWPLDQCGDQVSAHGIGFVDRSGNGKTLTGNQGGNATGLTCGVADFNFPWGPH